MHQFYVALILSAVETSESPRPDSNAKRIAGSYTKTLKYLHSAVGWGHFLSGVWTYLWTALLAYIARWLLTSYVLTPIPNLTQGGSLLSVLGGADMISALILEPLNILFTFSVLTSSSPTSPTPGVHRTPLRILFDLFNQTRFYTTLIYIQSLRIIILSIQTSLLVTERTEHYKHPFLTSVTYGFLFLIRITLITRAHASLLPPNTRTIIDIATFTGEERIELRLWQILIKTLWMGKLMIICVIISALHATLALVTLLQVSGQLNSVLQWIMAPKQSRVRADVGNGRTHRPNGHQGVGNDPFVKMGYEPELDRGYRH